MLNRIIFLFVATMLAGCSTPKHSPAPPQIVSVKKIWDAGKHNAFTDLIRFRGDWFCTFRESEAHVGGNGKIRVLTSNDGEHWQSAALVGESGVDLRDPKLSITPDGRLMLVLGGSIYDGRKLLGKQPRVSFSKDGRAWTNPQRVLSEGDWLWRVTWNKGRAYGFDYIAPVSPEKKAANEWELKLVASDDGVNFRTITKLDVPGHPNESTLRFLKNGKCIALVRREISDKMAWIGESNPPYRDWKWKSAGMQIGGPNFLVLDDGSMIASGRQYSPVVKTFIGRMNPESVKSELILPSGGDCSYPGMVWHKGLLWESYYSSHEGKTCIYFAKIKFNK